MSTVPGPAGHPLLGVVPAFVADLLGTLEATFAEHGDLVAYRFGPKWPSRTVYGAYHPDDVARAMTDPEVFGRDTAGFKVIRESIGDGLLTLDGETWKRHRKLVQQLFTHRRVMGYTALMAEEAAKIVDDPSLRSGTVDLHDLMQRYTLRVVGRALFGDAIDDIVEELQELVQQLGELSTARRLQLFTLQLSLPTPRNRKLRDVRRRLFAIADRVLDLPSDPNADDLLSRLRGARDEETGGGLSEQEIRDEVLGFLLAGHETTAGALTFTLHELGRRQDVQADIAHATDDTLVRATIQEGMRLYPPAHSTERITLVDTKIAGYDVRAGSQILISPWVTHRHPDFWPNPTTFDPSRFLDGGPTHRYAYIPFGGGARACIGMQFALMESTILLKTLLRSYRFDTTAHELSVNPLLTLRPNGPVRATATATTPQPV
ncbi:cytochrome P450 [Saccharothrix sp. NPDC042600]|uniref:cytochrome P450 n=1 Tax=Saccharothrix TaxID=2071 RepID=UPI0033E3877E|nr:cytochrome P450 [Saccharothrix mutabilis subsp. capreolus]